MSFDPAFLIAISSVRRFSRLALALTAVLVLASCTFAPVYGGRSGYERALDLAFEAPGSRLEQIIINELVTKFGRSANPSALRVKISVTSSAIAPVPLSVGLNALVTITDPTTGEILFSGTRSASASYSSSNQGRASQQAANEAAERAAKDLAQSIRATLLGVLLARQSQVSATSSAVLQ